MLGIVAMPVKARVSRSEKQFKKRKIARYNSLKYLP